MKIELKNVKISESLSEETTAFTADIFVNGKKAGYARNDGRGGCTNYQPFQETRELLNEAEKFTLTLPKIKYDFNGKTFEMDSNLENVIDNLLEKFQSHKVNGVFLRVAFLRKSRNETCRLEHFYKLSGRKGIELSF